MIEQRTEKHKIKQGHPYYAMLDDLCFKSKNLYNHALYVVRNEFIKNGKWIRYNELDKILKSDTVYPDYKNMPTAQSAQQLLKVVDQNFKSFFELIKLYRKNKDTMKKPNLPKYKKKSGRYSLILTNQNARYKNGVINFPKVFNGFTITPQFNTKAKFVSFQQIRIIPRNKCFTVELVYRIDMEEMKPDNGRYLGIDLGVNNLAAVSNNVGEVPFIIDGRGIKSINQWYDKQIAHYSSINMSMHKNKKCGYTKRLYALTDKRNMRMNDCMHKASRIIVERAAAMDISTIVIGQDYDWKRDSNIGAQNNQMFTQIPHMDLINKITYKAKEYGISVVTTEEMFTSGTSFLDGELPIEANYNISRRKKRGLFISNKGFRINADTNAAFQMIKKVFPNAFGQWNSGCAYHPVKVAIV